MNVNSIKSFSISEQMLNSRPIVESALKAIAARTNTPLPELIETARNASEPTALQQRVINLAARLEKLS